MEVEFHSSAYQRVCLLPDKTTGFLKNEWIKNKVIKNRFLKWKLKQKRGVRVLANQIS